MSRRLANMPRSLLAQSRFQRLCDARIPALLAHPNWNEPAPFVLWMHGRTVNKELDPGRYLRWIRSGIAVCAIDLPGHGERAEPAMQSPDHTLDVVDQAVSEIDEVIEALAAPQFKGVFDLDRSAIGGMSAGGMVTLRRLCEPHDFRCAAVESTAGDFSLMSYTDRFTSEKVSRLDPMQHLDAWRPIPLLALHSEADEWVPVAAIRDFIETLRAKYAHAGANADLAKLITWESTGAPYEHAGFGRHANDAKNLQLEFFQQHLLNAPRSASQN